MDEEASGGHDGGVDSIDGAEGGDDVGGGLEAVEAEDSELGQISDCVGRNMTHEDGDGKAERASRAVDDADPVAGRVGGVPALQRTLEFEEELAEKFGDSTHGRETGNDNEETGRGGNNSQTVSDIRKKYEKKLAAHQGSESEEKDRQKDLVPGAGFNFHGIVSSCFEPHLTVYVELEERTLMENLEKLVQEETWDIEEGNQTNILPSSMQVFLIIRRSLKRCSALTKSQTLLNLFKVFQRILKAYATKLFARLPKGGTGIVAAATGMDGQIKTSDRDERVICYIINTAEYCHKTSGELAENVSSIIKPQLADGVDMSEVQNEFSAVITKALVTLVHGLETKFDAEMVAMTRIPWGTLESVGDQSEYINSINMILTSSIPVLGSLLSPIYFQFFLDKLASSLGPRFYANIFKCKHISETGAQQMLLDTQAIKTILLDIPSLGRQTSGAASYSKFVSREMSKAEALLKVILSPVDSVADTYRALLPEGTPLEFQRILELKGMKKADQQSILDDFNKRGSGINQPPHMVAQSVVVPSVPTAPMAPTMSTPGSVGVIASREDVLTRAAALGRGAATTGFKRFLALTEAAKDRKDGPFRKLFNA
ncbi:vacuolar protein sorting-associated protein 53 A-like [Camellia sinensis]|uniref:vacuolar protein sorting-associated protein 53 A-like n=1 Tax=Camellia sinensis TaxID=4442 RepID=UPI0010361D2F|nr:vacuolar protein sorting-associated protein 53 A-like [Camellia sinensis]